MPHLKCANLACNRDFYSKHSTARYCSRRCSGIASMRNPEVAARQRERMRRYTDTELLSRLVEQARTLGRTPSCREATIDEATYRARFGSYNNAVLAAGLTPNVALPPSYLVRDRHAIPLSLRFKVLQRDGYRCQYCGGTPQSGYVLHVDHRVPFSQGGKTEEGNLVTSCLLCNLGKSDTTPE